MYAVNSVARFAVRIYTESLNELPFSKLLKQFMRVAYCVCQQRCVTRSEMLNRLSADFVLQIFIVSTAFQFSNLLCESQAECN